MYTRVSYFYDWVQAIQDSVSVPLIDETGLSGSSGSWTYRTVDVPDGAIGLSVAMAGSTGDADHYVRYGSQPTSGAYDCRPYLNGCNEACSFTSPSAGTWHIGINAYSTFSGLSLAASYSAAGAATEACGDGVDNDGDGDTDCADADCASDASCAGPTETCDDGVDNDGDGDTDCADSDCADSHCVSDPACASGVEDCDDGGDNDGDGDTDCDDSDCAGDASCTPEICDDGVDNNDDGDADCDDEACSGEAACLTEDCSNGMDDDGDGDVDCGDSTCPDEPVCKSCNGTPKRGVFTSSSNRKRYKYSGKKQRLFKAWLRCDRGTDFDLVLQMKLPLVNKWVNVAKKRDDGAAHKIMKRGLPKAEYRWVVERKSGAGGWALCVKAPDLGESDDAGISESGNIDGVGGLVGASELLSDDFESGWGNFTDGGSDARRSSNDAAYAASGSYCARLRDNSGSASSIYTDRFDTSAVNTLTVSFSFIAASYENGEDFFVELYVDGSWTVIGQHVRGTDFSNGTRYDEELELDVATIGTARLRFRSDASGNNDMVYIDDIVVTGS